MAGATNRALKAAGVPKSTIDTLRVEAGAGLSLRSALGIAHERGLPVGKAAEFHAAREAKRAASPAGQAAAKDFREKAAAAMKAAGERKAAMMAERQKRVAGTVRALGKGMLASRKAAAVPKLPDSMRASVETAAREHARRLVSAATETLQKGRRVFVKGKPVIEPHSAEFRKNLKRLQLDAFEPGHQVDSRLAPILGKSTEASYNAATRAYKAAGRAAVEAAWPD